MLHNCTGGQSCLACRNGNRPVTRYLLPLLVFFQDRTEGRVFIFGKMIFKDLRDIVQRTKGGDLRDNDLILNKNNEVGFLNKTDIMQLEPSKLSKEDLAIAQLFMKNVDLEEMSKPANNNDIMATLGQKTIYG